MDKIEVICMESDAFYKLLDEVIEYLKPVKDPTPDKWNFGPEAVCLLRIKCQTTSMGIPIDKLITNFFEYFNNLQAGSPARQAAQPTFDSSAINAIAEQLKKLTDKQTLIAEQVNEIHSVQFGKLYQAATTKEKKITKKQIEKAELMELRKDAHLRMMNRAAGKTTVAK